jgi:hypothetical protein
VAGVKRNRNEPETDNWVRSGPATGRAERVSRAQPKGRGALISDTLPGADGPSDLALALGLFVRSDLMVGTAAAPQTKKAPTSFRASLLASCADKKRLPRPDENGNWLSDWRRSFT